MDFKARCIATLIALTASAAALAQSLPNSGGGDPKPICDENHYILSEPCTPPGMPALDTAIGAPGSVAIAPDGSVYFSSPNIVLKLDAAGLVTRIAGNGTPGFSGDGGAATRALLNFPATYPELESDPIDFAELMGPLAVGLDGALFIGDAYNNRIRRVAPDGTIDTVLADVPLWWPQGIAVDAAATLYVTDGSGSLLKATIDGGRVRLAGNNCGPRFQGPGLCAPEGIALDGLGGVYVADGYCRIRYAPPGGVDTATVAGMDTKPDGHGFAFTCGRIGEGAPGIESAFAWPFAIAVDRAGNLLIADTYNSCIRMMDSNGIVTTFAGQCCGLYEWSCARSGFAGDGDFALGALLRLPHGVAVDPAGNVYIADTGNKRIRRVDPDGIITTVAGNGEDLPR